MQLIDFFFLVFLEIVDDTKQIDIPIQNKILLTIALV